MPPSNRMKRNSVRPASSTRAAATKLEPARSYTTCYTYYSLKILVPLVQTVGLVAAYLLGIFYNYERLAITVCPVPEYLPSVSETTGDYQPGQFITRLIVSFTLFPCLVDALLYYHQFVTQAPSLLQHKWWYQWLTKINLLMFIIKFFCFYTVTFIGLNESEDIHANSWCGYLLFTLLEELSFLILLNCGSCYGKKSTKVEQRIFKARCVLFILKFIGVMGFLNFSLKNFWYCEPYSLSTATIFEFLIFGCILSYEWMKLFDFRSVELVTTNE